MTPIWLALSLLAVALIAVGIVASVLAVLLVRELCKGAPTP